MYSNWGTSYRVSLFIVAGMLKIKIAPAFVLGARPYTKSGSILICFVKPLRVRCFTFYESSYKREWRSLPSYLYLTIFDIEVKLPSSLCFYLSSYLCMSSCLDKHLMSRRLPTFIFNHLWLEPSLRRLDHFPN